MPESRDSRPSKFIKKIKATKTSKWKPWTQIGLTPLATSRYSNFVSLNEYEILVATEYMGTGGGIYGFNALTNTWQCRSPYPRTVKKCFVKYSVEISITLNQSRDELFVFTLNWKRSCSLFKVNLHSFSYHIYVQNEHTTPFATLPRMLHSRAHHHKHKHKHSVDDHSDNNDDDDDGGGGACGPDTCKEVLHFFSTRSDVDMGGSNYIHKLFNVDAREFVDPSFDIKQHIKRLDGVVDIRGTSSLSSSSSDPTTLLKLLFFGGTADISEHNALLAQTAIWIYQQHDGDDMYNDNDEQKTHDDDDDEQKKSATSPLTQVQHTVNDTVSARDPKQRIHSIVCTNDHKFVILFGVKCIFVYDLLNAYCSACATIKYPESSDYSAAIVSTSVHDDALLNGYIYQHCNMLEFEIPKEIIVLIGKFFKQEYVHLIERQQITPMHWSVSVDALLDDSQMAL